MAQLGSGGGTSWPGAIDTRQTFQNGAAPKTDDDTRVDAEVINDLLTALVDGLQTGLGATPMGDFASVQARLDTFLPTSGSAAPFLQSDGSVAYTAPADFGGQALTNLGGANVTMLSGTAHPAQSPGVAAAVPAYYFRHNEDLTSDSAGQVWMKRGPADTDWSLVAPLVFTPEDFGGVGDGNFDNTDAFLRADAYFKDQNDLNNLWGTGVLWLARGHNEIAGASTPKSAYRIDQDVTLGYTSLMGNGWSVIDLGGAANTLAFDPVAAGVPGGGFEMALSGVVFRATVTPRTAGVPMLRIDNGTGPFTLSLCRFQVPANAVGVQYDTGDRSILSACQVQLGADSTFVVNLGATRLVASATTLRGSTSTTGFDLRAGSSQTTISPSVLFDAVTTRVLDNSGATTYITPRTIIAQDTWAPGSVGANLTTSTTIAAPGATIGEPVHVGITPILQNLFSYRADIDTNGVVTVILHNKSGSGQDPGTLTVSLVVFDTSGFFA